MPSARKGREKSFTIPKVNFSCASQKIKKRCATKGFFLAILLLLLLRGDLQACVGLCRRLMAVVLPIEADSFLGVDERKGNVE
jgi:hypothetical protein